MRARLPRWVYDVIFFAALLGVLAAVALRDWLFVAVNVVVAVNASVESRKEPSR